MYTQNVSKSIQVTFILILKLRRVLSPGFISCLSRHGQKSYTPMYKNETSHTACHTCNLPKQNKFFLIKSLSINEKLSCLDKKSVQCKILWEMGSFLCQITHIWLHFLYLKRRLRLLFMQRSFFSLQFFYSKYAF